MGGADGGPVRDCEESASGVGGETGGRSEEGKEGVGGGVGDEDGGWALSALGLPIFVVCLYVGVWRGCDGVCELSRSGHVACVSWQKKTRGG